MQHLRVERILGRDAHHQMRESRRSLAPALHAVRPEMRHALGLALEVALRDRRAVEPNYAADAAHEGDACVIARAARQGSVSRAQRSTQRQRRGAL